jgi:acylphosphatase
MSTVIARRCYVSGRVQGVFYRASTRQKATELGCSGYARNLPDGRVEVLAVGETQAVHSLLEWLWQGHRRARRVRAALTSGRAPGQR